MKRWVMIMLAVCALQVSAQDVHFSQFFAAPLITNPANTGNFTGSFRIGGNYRDQWGSVTIPYRTYDLYADAGISPGRSKNRLGIGLLALGDVAGDGALSSQRGLVSLAYHLQLDRDAIYRLSVGLSGGLIQRQIRFNQLTFDNQWNGYYFDMALPNGESGFNEDFTYWDAGAGVLLTISPLSYTRYFIGASVLHLNEPNESFYNDDNKLSRRLQLQTGAYFPLSGKLNMQPMAYVSLQGAAYEVIGGSNFAYSLNEGDNPRSWLFGVWYRYYDAAWLLMGCTFGNLSTSVSYDLNFSDLTAASNAMGGLELALVYTFRSRDKNNGLECPAYE